MMTMPKASPRQQSHEKKMRNLGRQRYWNAANKAQAAGRETHTAPGRRLLREVLGAYAQELRDFRKANTMGLGRPHGSKRAFEALRPEVVALIAARVLIDGSLKPYRRYTALAMEIGRWLEDEARLVVLKKENPLAFKAGHKSTKHAKRSKKRDILRRYVKNMSSAPTWKATERFAAGAVCIEVFRRVTGFVDLKMIRDTKPPFHNHRCIMFTPDAKEWFEKVHESHELLTPVYLPTFDEPDDWQGIYDGGYKSQELRRRALVKPQMKVHYDELEKADLSEVMGAVNHLQKTKWLVNKDVHEVIKAFWESGVSVASLVEREDEPLPPKDFDAEDYEDTRRWKTAAREVYYRNAAKRSQRLQVARTLTVCETLGDLPFFFPYQTDFRGRFYTLPKFLDPMGTDLARGVLQFGREAEIKTEEELNWLAIHGANCFGLDKVPFEERIGWVHKNRAEITQVYRDPIDYRWWTTWDEPWQGLAFCLEWGRIMEHGLPAPTRLPVQIDGSNNGLQIFALLLRDPSAAAATNVLGTPGMVEDIYAAVADRVTKELKAATGEAGEKAQIWLQFFGGKLPRGLLKKPTMTYAYSATRYSCSDYVFEWASEYADKVGYRPFGGRWIPECTALAGYIWRALKEVVTSATEAMDWLREVAKLSVAEGKAIRWTSPSGFPVIQEIRNWKTREVRTAFGDIMRFAKIRYTADTLSKTKMLNSISPNYVHSLDSAILHKAVNRCGLEDLLVVHDSFGTHAPNAAHLGCVLREVYAEVFQENQLEIFRKQAQSYIDAPLPELPELGDLDPRCVLDSPYFFA